jgi:hypothetical protein
MEFLRRRLGMLTLALACAGPVLLNGPSRAQQTALAVRERSNEHVSLASDDQFVVATWAATKANAGTDVFAVTSRDGGLSFSDPVRVNQVEGQANVNGEQPPQVVIASPPKASRTVTVIWTAKLGAGTRVLIARSSDDGRTFSAAVPVQSTDGAGNRGWESIAADREGRTFALWLDHRDMAASARSGEVHQHGPQASQLYVAALDGSTAQSLTRGVCYCCRTALAAVDGKVYAAWRHVYADNHRDIAFTMSRDGGRRFGPPVRVSDDDWQIDGCPENGPALTVDRQDRVHVVWPTRVVERGSETLALFHAVTMDGRSFSPRARIATGGTAYHPRLATAPDGSVVAAWDEVARGTRRVRLARGAVNSNGAVTFRPMELGQTADGRYPAIVFTRSHIVVAWTSAQAGTSRIAVARIPLS